MTCPEEGSCETHPHAVDPEKIPAPHTLLLCPRCGMKGVSQHSKVVCLSCHLIIEDCCGG